MGADMFLADAHRIIVTGLRSCVRRQLDTRDLRSGMSLIAAGLRRTADAPWAAETVERGYSQLVERSGARREGRESSNRCAPRISQKTAYKDSNFQKSSVKSTGMPPALTTM